MGSAHYYFVVVVSPARQLLHGVRPALLVPVVLCTGSTWSTGAVNQSRLSTSSHFAFSRVSRGQGLVPSQTWWVHEGLLKYCLVSDEGDIASTVSILASANGRMCAVERSFGVCKAAASCEGHL